MAQKSSRRNFSFDLLANISPSDGDSWNVNGGDSVADERSDKPRRRRRKNKSKKTSAGDMSPVSAIPDELGSAISTLDTSHLPPHSSSVPAYGEDSFAYPSDWPVGISPTGTSPSVPTESPYGPVSSTALSVQHQTSSSGVLNEYGSGSPTEWELPQSNHLDSAKHLAEVGSKLTTHGAEDDFMSMEVLKENLGHNKEEAAIEKLLLASSPSSHPAGRERSPLRSLSFKGNLQPESPDFSAANGGMMEPSFAPGTLYPPGELRQRVHEKNPKKQSDEKVTEVSLDISSRVDSYPAASSDERANFASENRLVTNATPYLKDWERLMDSSGDPPPVELSPLQYIRSEVFGGSALRNSNAAGSDQRREQIYNTMFHVPWRCELLIDVGFFVCLDAFLSLFTLVPARIAMYLWQQVARFSKSRQLRRPGAAELCDFGCLIVLVVGVAVLRQVDISILYHWIRCQGVVKLYVIFNVLEIFDKLCQSFGSDVLQVLFNSALSLENCSGGNFSSEMARFALDQGIAVVCYHILKMFA
ncbi:hypothetical protein R1sor_002731 [Riccia sorocarpa]|uniref:Uncharacterized protein n=1 Tax=Riccia sorocarpa TaxID=122646 RepID=A0ABD3H5Q7_9MARC